MQSFTKALLAITCPNAKDTYSLGFPQQPMKTPFRRDPAFVAAIERERGGLGANAPQARYPSVMDVRQIVEQLIQERDQLDEAILSLERLGAGQRKRRGRPPAWLTGAVAANDKPKRRGRPPGRKKTKPEQDPESVS